MKRFEIAFPYINLLSKWFAKEDMYYIGCNEDWNFKYYLIVDRLDNPRYLVQLDEDNKWFMVKNLDGNFIDYIAFSKKRYKGTIMNHLSNKVCEYVINDLSKRIPMSFSSSVSNYITNKARSEKLEKDLAELRELRKKLDEI